MAHCFQCLCYLHVTQYACVKLQHNIYWPRYFISLGVPSLMSWHAYACRLSRSGPWKYAATGESCPQEWKTVLKNQTSLWVSAQSKQICGVYMCAGLNPSHLRWHCSPKLCCIYLYLSPLTLFVCEIGCPGWNSSYCGLCQWWSLQCEATCSCWKQHQCANKKW